MLGYLNGIGRVKSKSINKKNILKKALAIYPPAVAVKLAQKAINRGKQEASSSNVRKGKTILKKAFSVLPPVMAINVAKKIISRNKNLPNSASQLTQQRALKNQLAKTKAKLFEENNKSLMLDDENLTETPAVEQSYEDKLMDQEVENEIQQEEEFKEAEEDLGIIYNTGFLSGKAERKAKKAAKTAKIQSKAELKKAKGEAKINRSTRPRKTAKEMFDDGLDVAKKGFKVYSDIKGGKSMDDESSDVPVKGRTANQTEEEGFFAKNKTMILIGGGVLAIGAILLLKGKGKNK
jgi:regulator of replication initiation timing